MWSKADLTGRMSAILCIIPSMATEEQIHWFAWRIQRPPYADKSAICDSDHFSKRKRLLGIVLQQTCTLSRRTNKHMKSDTLCHGFVYAH